MNALYNYPIVKNRRKDRNLYFIYKKIKHMTVSRQDRTGLTQSKEKEGEKAQEGSRFNEKVNRKDPP